MGWLRVRRFSGRQGRPRTANSRFLNGLLGGKRAQSPAGIRRVRGTLRRPGVRSVARRGCRPKFWRRPRLLPSLRLRESTNHSFSQTCTGKIVRLGCLGNRYLAGAGPRSRAELGRRSRVPLRRQRFCRARLWARSTRLDPKRSEERQAWQRRRAFRGRVGF